MKKITLWNRKRKNLKESLLKVKRSDNLTECFRDISEIKKISEEFNCDMQKK